MLALLSSADGVVGCDFDLILYSKYEKMFWKDAVFLEKVNGVYRGRMLKMVPVDGFEPPTY